MSDMEITSGKFIKRKEGFNYASNHSWLKGGGGDSQGLESRRGVGREKGDLEKEEEWDASELVKF